MNRDRFRHALASKLGEVITPELAAWLELLCMPYEVGFVTSVGVGAETEMFGLLARLQEEMMYMPQVECQIREHFSPGLYAREITIPKGAALIGAVHKTTNMAVLSRGRLRLVTETGITDISADDENQVMTVHHGAKNAVVALETAVWTNYHPTTETDPDKLVEMFTHSRRDELAGGPRNLQLLHNGGAILKIGGK